MKKTILAIVVLVTVENVLGQSPLQNILGRLSYGIKAGVNYSDFTNANFKTSGLTGFHAGFFVALRLTHHFSIQEDFLFSAQGAKVEDDRLAGKDALKLSYLSIPIVLKYRTKPGFYFEAGVQTGMLVADAKNTGIGDFANKLDMGVVGGIGYKLKLGTTKRGSVGIRYYQGLTEVGKFTSATLNPDFKNSLAQLSFSYFL